MAFVLNEHNVTWSVMASSSSPATLITTSTDLMEDPLLTFAPLFAEPKGLPPQRQRSHMIQLVVVSVPVAVRPY
jgi:hypothetical protein